MIIHSFKGRDSQTGIALRAKFPDAELRTYDSWDEIPVLLAEQTDPIAVPVWNSHKGEVKNALWERLLGKNGFISALWSSPIQFWHVSRGGDETKSVCSVKVAKEQCSRFIEKQGLQFHEYNSTIEARDIFVAGQHDSVLIAPDQIVEGDGRVIVSKETANPNNFTSFVLIQKVCPAEGTTRLSGVTMPRIEEVLTDPQKEFLGSLFQGVEALSGAPRLLFVFNREEESSSIGLLLEGAEELSTHLYASLSEESPIEVNDEVGRISTAYSVSLQALLLNKFKDLCSDGFVRHMGVTACLYSCPPLGLHTHGYDKDVVEPVFRYYVDRLFNALNRGMSCDQEQVAFFQAHKARWQELGPEFIEFHEVRD